MSDSLSHTGHRRCTLRCSQRKLTILTCVLVLLLHAHVCVSSNTMPYGDARQARYRRQAFPPRPGFCRDPLGFRCDTDPAGEFYEHCLPLQWLCDGTNDCFMDEDGLSRDEAFCTVGTPCDEELCSKRGLCSIVASGTPGTGSINCDCLPGIMGPNCQSGNINQIPQPTLDQITQSSVRLNWNQPAPVFQGNSDATITNYIVTLTPTDGSPPLSFDNVPADGTSYTINGLNPGSTYIVDTDYYVSRGPGEQPMPYNVDLPSQTFTTMSPAPVVIRPLISEVMSNSARITFPGTPPVLPGGTLESYFVLAYPLGSDTPISTMMISASQGASDLLSGLTPASCIRVEFNGILPGTQELIPIPDYPDQIFCTPAGTTAMPTTPSPPIVPIIHDVTGTSFGITFPGDQPATIPNDPEGRQLVGYIVTLRDSTTGQSVSQTVDAVPDASYTFENLTPGTMHTVDVFAIAQTANGNRQIATLDIPTISVSTSILTTTNPPTTTQTTQSLAIVPIIHDVTSTSFGITFPGDQPATVPNDPEGRRLIAYLVTQRDSTTGQSVSQTIDAQPDASYTFENLTPGTMHSVDVFAIAEAANGNQQIATLDIPTITVSTSILTTTNPPTTTQTTQSPAIVPIIHDVTETSVGITFPGDQPATVPNDPEGRRLIGYIVTLTDSTTGQSVSQRVDAQPDASHNFENLSPGTMYTMGVFAIAQAANGNQQIATLDIPTISVSTSTATCADDEFACADDTCVSAEYECDYFNDCPDNSDEINCECDATLEEFQCASGGCINSSWVCDEQNDCLDGSDEVNCTCAEDEYTCEDGEQCIPVDYVCDYVYDCYDYSDEMLNCTCDLEVEFECDNGGCINATWVCDGEEDCTDGSDESACLTTEAPVPTTVPTCPSNETQCDNGECVPSEYWCDSFVDCSDRSDELRCCPDTKFNCDNGRCIEWDQWCDGASDDCRDNSDEDNCADCTEDEYRCHTNVCIPSDFQCDYILDCDDYSDEVFCECDPETEFACTSGGCVNATWVCDGESDCLDGSDELNCTCPEDTFACGDGSCVPEYFTCDYIYDCSDYSDETANCTCDPYNEFECDAGGCINSTWVCDGDEDCLDGSDEMACGPTCPPGEFPCADGTCISKDWACDGIDDCASGSDEDETFCAACPFKFLCSNGRCTDKENVCDGRNHCRDNSDETQICVELPSLETGDIGGRSVTLVVNEDPPELTGEPQRDITQYAVTLTPQDDGPSQTVYVPAAAGTEIEVTGLQPGSMYDALVEAVIDTEGREESFDIGIPSFNFETMFISTTGAPGTECAEDEYRCGTNVCIPEEFQCDYIIDCEDNSDEIECECDPESEFACTSGGCVNATWVCDGESDCFDDSDELNCTCPEDTFACGDGSCIPEFFTCDYIYDCSDYSDETANCTCDPSNEFECGVGGCINGTWVCDGDEDCLDGSDEVACEPGPTCPRDEFPCADGTCISKDWACDGIDDCASGSDEDEAFCATCPFQFLCSNGRCTDKENVCDGRNQCRDNSDESQICVELPSLAIEDIDGRSATLKVNEDPPEITGEPRRTVTQYAVTLTPQDGGPSQTVFVPADAGSEVEVTDLEPETTYDVLVEPVIDTEGQGEESFDVGKPLLNFETQASGDECTEDEYRCGTDVCIPKEFQCDYITDCEDNSDEIECDCNPETEFLCAGGGCINATWYCDSEEDCFDGSDEGNCTCTEDQFQCDNGGCVPLSYQCDYVNDCGDNSDELADCECDPETEFECETGGCINGLWVCDGEEDCNDGSDELFCNATTMEPGTTEMPCPENQIRCGDGECIPSEFWCDTFADCSDRSDELRCCPDTQFNCDNGRCIEWNQWCDGASDDCRDNSDEDNCAECGEDEYRCHTNVCVPSDYKCDYVSDCEDNSDEIDECECDPEIEFACASGGCVNITWVCDGEPDCFDGSDETGNCTCLDNEFACEDGSLCIPEEYACDYISDCEDNSDEILNCTCDPNNEFECDIGGCINGTWVCDGEEDCSDGSDEKNCFTTETPTEAPTCPDGQFFCDDGLCVPKEWACDGVMDCASGYDETEDFCATCPFKFFCTNGRCTDLANICEGIDHCGDDSDETQICVELPSPTVGDIGARSVTLNFDEPPPQLESEPPRTITQYAVTLTPQDGSPAQTVYVPAEAGEFEVTGLQPETPYDIEIAPVVQTEGQLEPEVYSSLGMSPMSFETMQAPTTEAPIGTTETPCPGNGRRCDDGVCIPSEFWCDEFADCSDRSDELMCCPDTQYNCANGRCIEWDQWCDGASDDCRDNSDEDNCAECTEDEYRCHTNVCISADYRCDYIADCEDNSDEMFDCECDATIEFECDSGGCVNATWQCDGEADCFDSSDERYCDCPSETSPCDDGICVPNNYFCDYVSDCFDNSDESNCTCDTDLGEFECDGGGCINGQWVCDGESDCFDGSDENVCGSTEPPGTEAPTCPPNEFFCADGTCISKDWACDGIADCADGSDEDETFCATCPFKFLCANGFCTEAENVCDGRNQCRDNSDETQICDGELPSPTVGDVGARSVTLNWDEPPPQLESDPARKISQYAVTFTPQDGGPSQTVYVPADADEYTITGLDPETVYDTKIAPVIETEGQEEGVTFEDLGIPSFIIETSFAATTDTATTGAATTAIGSTATPCPANNTRCGSGECLPNDFWCDSYADCEDRSDELRCCPDTQFNCDNGRCIEWDQWCDANDDCRDNSDEDNCAECSEDEYRCRTNVCVPGDYRCDYITDCEDNSDEIDECECDPELEFECASGGCVNITWVCDGQPDCFDGSDEEGNCTCSDDQFACEDGACIPDFYACDYVYDCEDLSDEIGDMCSCNVDYEFECDIGGCVNATWVCDGEDDCDDGSDESVCGTTETPAPTCPAGEFMCGDGQCIPTDWACDGIADCLNGTDEEEDFCATCPFQFFCSNGRCTDTENVCDGRNQCRDNSDESQICDIELPSPTIGDIGGRSVTLNLDDAPPALESDPPRSITEYAVTLTPQDGGPSQTAYIPAEPGNYTIAGLKPETMYNAEVAPVVETEGQDEPSIYNNLGGPTLEFETVFAPTTVASSTEDIGTPEPTCPPGEFFCADGACVPQDWACDGIEDCADGSDEDEAFCATCPFQFFCSNGRCTDTENVCDGRNQCRDNSDESQICDVELQSPTVGEIGGRSVTLSLDDAPPALESQPPRNITQYAVTLTPQDGGPSQTVYIPAEPGNYSISGLKPETMYDAEVAPVIETDGQADPIVYNNLGFSLLPFETSFAPTTAEPGTTESVNRTECADDEYRCPDNVCIPSDYRCDYIADCEDNSDEIDECECEPEIEFACASGGCVNITWVCDGESDCFDESDEVNCTCGEDQFACADGLLCIPEFYTCDYFADCYDNSDEIANCTCDPYFEFECESGGCINGTWVCDGYDDCLDGSDENECTTGAPVTEEPTCPPGEFFCADGTCVTQDWACDGFEDCADGSDEDDDFCATCPFRFLCANGLCTDTENVCDGRNQCRDNSDESQICDVELPSPTIGDIGGRSVTLTLDDAPPAFESDPPRNITQYAVTLTPQDGGPSQTAYIPAEPGNYTISGLKPETMYDAEIAPVIETEGQDEPNTYDNLGSTQLVFETVFAPTTESGTTEYYTPEPTCPPGEFFCDDGNCITQDWACDGFDDCASGSDEDEAFCATCPFKFFCSNGLCTDPENVCDGRNQCRDNSDESQICDVELPSPTVGDIGGRSVTLGWDEAPPALESIPPRNITQYAVTLTPEDGGPSQTVYVPAEPGNYTISGLKPETAYEAEVAPVIETEGQAEPNTYNNLEITPVTFETLFAPTTIASSTESATTDIGTPEPTCPPGEFFCADGTCVTQDWACDGIEDCADGSDEDEAFCATCPFQFFCSNGLCIDTENVCDGRNQCRDNSDESQICEIPLPSISVGDIGGRSVSLSLDDAPPALESDPTRNITGYAVTFTPQDGGPSQTVYLPAEPGNYTISDLQPETAYDVEVAPVIETDGQSEPAVYNNLGSPPLEIETGIAQVTTEAATTENSNATACSEDEYRCPDNVCIPSDYRCDYIADCEDSSDEIDECECEPEIEFACASGGCVNITWICDGAPDCFDGSDEENCTCGEDEFACLDGLLCIPEEYTCDYITDCYDNSDEIANCTCDEYTEFECGSGGCINGTWVCDGEDDCLDGSDESTCTTEAPGTEEPTCPPSEFLCADGVCVSQDWACDGIEDCADGSDEDEAFCATCPFKFFCSNGRCTDTENVCDGRNQCRDNSDESQFCDIELPSPTVGDIEGRSVTLSWDDAPPALESDPPRNITEYAVTLTPQDGGPSQTVYVPAEPGNYTISGLKPETMYETEVAPVIETNGQLDPNTYDNLGIAPFTFETIFAPTTIASTTESATTEYYTPEPTCPPGEFFCADGACVSQDWACDDIEDCADGSDEDEAFCATCPFKFFCSNGRCTDTENVCDGRNQCRDNSDESQICDIELPSPAVGDIEGRSVTLSWDDAPPALESDPPRNITEYAVTLTPQDGGPSQTVYVPAEPGNYTISGLKPETVYETEVAPVMETEGQSEPNTYDNLGIAPFTFETIFAPTTIASTTESATTEYYTPEPTCPPGEFFCDDGACVSQDWACDGFEDCADGSDEDEAFCATCPFQFFCSNGRCTDTENVCDGRNQCRDNSDESQICDIELPPLSVGDIGGRSITLSLDDAPPALESDPQRNITGYAVTLTPQDGGPSQTVYLPAEPGNYTISDLQPETMYDIEVAPVIETDGQSDPAVYNSLGSPPLVIETGIAPTTAEPGSECAEDEYRCPDNVCIPSDYRCDYIADCEDDSDEIDECECEPEIEFACASGGCVNITWICDGAPDCFDGSDEENCTCGEDEFACLDGLLCIPEEYTCDYISDCYDNSDEIANCTCDEYTEFECGSGGCINGTWVCDGEDDCLDGSDESACTTEAPGTEAPTCPPGEFFCDDGTCVTQDYACDGIEDCADGSDEDEAFCATCPFQFLCSNGLCTDTENVCDGRNQCRDNSDESQICDVELPSPTVGDIEGRSVTLSWDDAPPALESSPQRNITEYAVTLTPQDGGPSQTVYVPAEPGNYTISGLKPETLYEAEVAPVIETEGQSDPYTYNNFGTVPFSFETIFAPTTIASTTESATTEYYTPEPTCPPGEFFCDDGTCVTQDWACDGIEDCADGSDEDEAFCATCPFQFLCANGFCTDSENVCDGRNQCRDNSDESQICDVELPSPTVGDIEGRSVTLSWDDAPPALDSVPPRNITQYAVTLTPEDGGPSQTLYVPAEPGNYTISGLKPETIYEAEIAPVIETGGQDEPNTYDNLGIAPFTFETIFAPTTIASSTESATTEYYTPEPTCPPGEFFCDDGTCVTQDWACDGIEDCADGSDEDEGFCATCPFQFLCANGFCTDSENVCDGRNQCRDNSDESQICDVELPSPTVGDIEGRSVTLSWDDAPPALESVPPRNITQYAVTLTPEDGGPSQTVHVPAEPGNYTISGLKPETIYEAEIAPVIETGGQDEPNTYDNLGIPPFTFETIFAPTTIASSTESATTEYYTPEPTCPPGEFFCDDGACVSQDWACDGIEDCADGSDENETFCATCPFEFLCSNGFCTDNENVCDGRNQCRDNSDESQICDIELPPLSVGDIGGRSITLSLDDAPPALESDPQRNITGYAVTLTPQDGGPPQTVYLPAEPGNYTISDLQPETMYDIEVAPVIETDGQSEPAVYNSIESAPLEIETGIAPTTAEPGTTESVNATGCAADEYRCLSNTSTECIPSAYRCDYFPDCEDFSDEFYECECDLDIEYACAIGGCVNITWVCDGELDCFDGSDEVNCTCEEDEFACVDGLRCIPEDFTCDYIHDCFDNSDEIANCTCDQNNEFECESGGCINGTWVCDGEDDCLDGSDESACTTDVPGTEAPTCQPDEFFCTDGTCISKEWACDGFDDCADGSDEDEAFCDTCPFRFLCSNGRCTDTENVCDGRNQCRDNSDESQICNVDVPSPSVADIGSMSVTLSWDEPPPSLESDPPRNITQYAVTLTPQDGGPSQTVYVPAEAGANYTISGLKPETMYDMDIRAVIETEGQEEAEPYDLGIPSQLVETLFAPSTAASTTSEQVTGAPTCPPDEFFCTDGTCISKEWACDGFDDCADGSDEVEAFCDTCPFRFLCSNGRCTDTENVCDGRNQCRDNSDETSICDVDVPSPSVADIGSMSVTLSWDEPPPALESDPPRNITQYAVTLTPQDGGPSQTVYVPAEAGANYTISGLNPETMYDMDIRAVIETVGQEEAEPYDLGIPSQLVETFFAPTTPASNTTECADFEFRCDNNDCIPIQFQCDYIADCVDFSDEIYGCECDPETEFTCAEGGCVNATWVCDGEYDCHGEFDASDELNCTCSEDEFTCAETGCVPAEYRCDYEYDCADYSDEIFNCTCDLDSEFECDGGGCIRSTWVCDGEEDCYDGSDESAYICGTNETTQSPGTEAPTCPPDEFFCADGTCVPKDWACDGFDDCADGSDEDEEFCASCPFKFLCSNGRCTDTANVCDGRNQCRDNSDETQLCVDVPAPSVSDIGGRSVTLSWDEPPPALESDPPRNITEYAVTLTPRDGGPSQTVYVPAEAGANYTISGLKPETMYDMDIRAVIETEGQEEAEPYDLGIPQMLIETPSAPTTPPPPPPPPTSPPPPPPTTEQVGTTEPPCEANHTRCGSGECVSNDYWCDGYGDCTDRSDELMCCPESLFNCANGRCIEFDLRCDGSDDCRDNSDEEGCAECADDEYRCRTNVDVCIPLDYQCDYIADCEDSSDETDACECDPETEFSCAEGGCVNATWVCDGQYDCFGELDASDELNCTCPEDQFTCAETGLCVPAEYTCDFIYDCADYSDELLNCTCDLDSEFECDGGGCINGTWVCDGEEDCYDGSDESAYICGTNETTQSPGTEEPTCSPDEFMCNDGACVFKDWACDGTADCADESDEDEAFCATCPFQFLCTNGRCTDTQNVCDGRNQCRDNSDETQICDVEIPSPTVGDVEGRSFTLNWDEPPPELISDPPRTIVEYAVTVTPQDGSPPQTLTVPAEAGAVLEVMGLNPEMMYDVEIAPVILTEGKEEPEKYDLLGPQQLNVETGPASTTTEASTTKEPTCAPDEFLCNDGACVFKDWACDGTADCVDESDEDEAFCATCPFQFLCTNGRCTDTQNVCDGRNQCRDNSDESQICDVEVPSPTVGDIEGRSFTLNWDEPPPELTSDPPRTIVEYDVTVTPQDGGPSQTLSVPAEAGAVLEVSDLDPETMYDIEISPVVLTDGKEDPETYDLGVPPLTVETGISTGVGNATTAAAETTTTGFGTTDLGTTSEPTCPPDEFMCNDGACVFKDWACDGTPDCADESDEDDDFCASCPFQFLCTNGRCTDTQNVCDGRNQCRDNSDETQICDVEVPSPTVGDIEGRSFTLNWDEPPPELTSDPPRTIVEYDVTVTPQDGGPSQTLSVPAEAGAVLEVSDLDPETMYDIEISPVVLTDGKEEPETYDLGVPPLIVETGAAPTTAESSTMPANVTGTIPTNVTEECGSEEFRCNSSGECIPISYRCDYIGDCEDFSDEIIDCTCDPDSEFECDGGGCINGTWVCDGEQDCYDGSDESASICGTNVTECGSDEFKCNSSGECIPISYRCDYFTDCEDFSDEIINCTCDPDSEFECDGGGCINGTWVCDGEQDCYDGSDESAYICGTNETGSCNPDEFQCVSGNTSCIGNNWVCDRVADCDDGSDELVCCATDQITCPNFRCVNLTNVCDGTNDCGDMSDEENCQLTTVETATGATFCCTNGETCIPQAFQCDKFNDCQDGSDEMDCPNCQVAHEFECGNGRCIPLRLSCNGDDNCGDNSDEALCP